jgi:hypothetical protein
MSDSTRELLPASALPLAYYVCAYGALLSGLGVLVLDPATAGSSFYHPRMIGLAHLLTLGWITGSILGSLYIVGPLALRAPMPVGWLDWTAWAAFAAGTSVGILSFWSGQYDRVAWSGGLVLVAILRVLLLALPGLVPSPAPRGVILHVLLAFVNVLGAGLIGILLALNRSRGFLEVSPLSLMFAHVHLAAIGWASMMVVGLAYRLIPMMLPAAMPVGPRIAMSAVLLQAGLLALLAGLVAEPRLLLPSALTIVAGLASFSLMMRATVKHRMPRPPALPRRDWSAWQAHAALGWLLVAVIAGLWLAIGVGDEWRLQLMWGYGVAGLVGFLGQMVAGIQGRLVPWYAWYRAFARAGGPPQVGANALPSAAFASAVFAGWTCGVPLLATGLALDLPLATQVGAALLSGALVVGFSYMWSMLRRARTGMTPVIPPVVR